MKIASLLLIAACSNSASLGHSTTSAPSTPSSFGPTRWTALLDNDWTGAHGVAFSGDAFVVGGEHGADGVITAFIAVYADTDGALRWRRDLADHSEIHAIAATSDGVVVTGAFLGDVDFGGTTLSSGLDTPAAFIARYSTAGDLMWVQAIQPTRLATFDAVTVANDGTIYAGGWFRGVVDVGGGPVGRTTDWQLQGDAMLLAYKPDGTRLWGETFVGAGSNIAELVASPDGVIASGMVHAGVSLGGPPETDGAFVATYTSAGVYQSSRVISSTSNLQLVALAPDGSLLEARDEQQHTQSTAVLAQTGDAPWTSQWAGNEIDTLVAGSNVTFIGGACTSQHGELGDGPIVLAAIDNLGGVADVRSLGSYFGGAQGMSSLALGSNDTLGFAALVSAPADFGNGVVTPTDPTSTAIGVIDPPPVAE